MHIFRVTSTITPQVLNGVSTFSSYIIWRCDRSVSMIFLKCIFHPLMMGWPHIQLTFHIVLARWNSNQAQPSTYMGFGFESLKYIPLYAWFTILITCEKSRGNVPIMEEIIYIYIYTHARPLNVYFKEMFKGFC